ncbi:MAG: cell division protein FtsZ [Bacteroidia bacterium]
MKFNLPKENASIIKVIGVGGGGSNAVNHMYKQGIKGVDFLVCNTDAQALDISPVPLKIQLGESLTEGRGAGSLPEVGKNAAIENIEQIKEILNNNTRMVFVTAGMGGGTGTGAAPVIAKQAKDMGILTVGIVTVPFGFEGRKRKQQAEMGIEEMRDSVDTLLIINNDKLREMFGNLSLSSAFAQADDVLTTAARGIAELISVTGQINVDFNDVNTVMRNSGVAIMGSATAEGENRAVKAVEKALASPLLNDNNIFGAKYVLLNITYGNNEVSMDEISDITDYIQEEAGSSADVIWGHALDENLGSSICVTLIATGFNSSPDTGISQREPQKKRMNLDEELKSEITAPMESPVASKEAVINEMPSVENSKNAEEELEEPFLVNDSSSNNVNEKPQTEITFDITNEESSEEPFIKAAPAQQPTASNTPQEPVKRYFLDESVNEEKQTSSTTASSSKSNDESSISREEQLKKSEERIARIKELTLKLSTPAGLTELENEPAYRRRNLKLEDTPHSSESNVSKFTISEEKDENGKRIINLRDNNSFLHDNVD